MQPVSSATPFSTLTLIVVRGHQSSPASAFRMLSRI